MKLIITPQDLEQAIRLHISGLMTLSDKAKMEVEIKDGSVEVHINYMDLARLPGFDTPKPATPTPAEIPQQVVTSPVPAPVMTNGTPAQEVPKIDGRSKAAREQKKKSLFDRKPEEAPKPGEAPIDAVDRAVDNLTRDPTPEEIERANRAAEAAEIVQEAETNPTPVDDAEVPTEVEAPDIPAEVETPPPAPTTPRKSLFANS